jgi:hypothetical protein
MSNKSSCNKAKAVCQTIIHLRDLSLNYTFLIFCPLLVITPIIDVELISIFYSVLMQKLFVMCLYVDIRFWNWIFDSRLCCLLSVTLCLCSWVSRYVCVVECHVMSVQLSVMIWLYSWVSLYVCAVECHVMSVQSQLMLLSKYSVWCWLITHIILLPTFIYMHIIWKEICCFFPGFPLFEI